MTNQNFNMVDKLISEFDHALRVINGKVTTNTPSPEKKIGVDKLILSDKSKSAKLMRVNHSGEISAQALYRGQAFFARTREQRNQLLAAADDENNHLAWCKERVNQLDGNTSIFTPIWYGGSFILGITAGLAGDKVSLGFIAETERQVAKHLANHLDKLPKSDQKSYEILKKMRTDEIRHGSEAEKKGTIDPPKYIKNLMAKMAKIMTTVSYHL
ncbi:MAG: 2-polyprenyl-3-methyl-6-methoxy-1,4-benzoquinone monooxygenase [Pseudomonadota bacterium]|nr:2-polyprenyl-3-methyl-6-methoxy-1,4-benzoquinone monooxygenase [Pseudomonadota bacterium]